MGGHRPGGGSFWLLMLWHRRVTLTREVSFRDETWKESSLGLGESDSKAHGLSIYHATCLSSRVCERWMGEGRGGWGH